MTSVIQITLQQIGILQHALGWPDLNRNRFVTGTGSDDYEACESLVEKGLMSRHSSDWIPGFVYVVTSLGKEVIIGRKVDV